MSQILNDTNINIKVNRVKFDSLQFNTMGEAMVQVMKARSKVHVNGKSMIINLSDLSYSRYTFLTLFKLPLEVTSLLKTSLIDQIC